MNRLVEVATRHLATEGDGLEAVEAAVRTAMTQLGASLLERLLAADVGYRGPRVGCGAGHEAGFVGYRTKSIDTVLGPIELRRAYYHCADCAHVVVPRDDELGVIGVSQSPGLARMVARTAAAVPFAQAGTLLHELAGVQVSTKRIQRGAEADGRAAATAIESTAQAILGREIVPLPPARPTPDKLYITIDGTGVPMVPAATAGRAGKHPDGRARTREVKLACLFTQTRLDHTGHPVRDEHSSSYVASFAPADQFAPLVEAEARRRGSEHIRQLIVIGDGAAWIWNLAWDRFANATQIVDLYHAREHLHDLAAFLAPHLDDHPAWLAARRDDLDAGDIDAITTAAHAVTLAADDAHERDRHLAYFHTNADRMRYADFRDLGMFIGSGAVEAGCKNVIGQRLKLSGMRWSQPGATGILTLRCQQASGRFDEIWQRPHNQTRAA